MTFLEKAKADKDVLLQKWVDLFYSAYPLGSSGFVRTSRDKFTNPIGLITQNSLTILYDAVIGEDVEPKDVQKALSEVVHLRAIQSMAPSKAVGVLAQLKTLLKEDVLPEYIKNNDSKALSQAFDEYFIVDARIDALLLMSLDMYASDREKVFNLRVEEIHRNQSQVVRWAKLREEKMTNNYNSEG